MRNTPKEQKSESPQPAGDHFGRLYRILEKWFYKPDLQAFRVIVGTMKAHYLPTGDPAWLFVVAPPGTGKTTMGIMGASKLPDVHMLGGFTANTFLSGFHGHREPGLLEKLGETTEKDGRFTTGGDAILLAKDFTTVLSMRRETRSEILAQLREIHDGEFRRAFGTGETKIWRGRITVIAAVTPIIDRYYSIFTVLGERFLQLRWHRPESPEAGQQAIRQQGYEKEIRTELREAIQNLVLESTDTPPILRPAAEVRLASMAELVAFARTHVMRSSYGNREINYVPEPEANTRLSKELAAVAKGIAAINGREVVGEPDLQDSFRVAFDSIPDNRRRLLVAIAQDRELDDRWLPRTVQEREIEELKALGLLSRSDDPTLTRRAARLLGAADVVMGGTNLIK